MKYEFDLNQFKLDDTIEIQKLIRKYNIDRSDTESTFQFFFRGIFVHSRLFKKQCCLLRESFGIFIQYCLIDSNFKAEDYIRKCVIATQKLKENINNFHLKIIKLKEYNLIRNCILLKRILNDCFCLMILNMNAINDIYQAIRTYIIHNPIPIVLIKNVIRRHLFQFDILDENFQKVLEFETELDSQINMEELD